MTVAPSRARWRSSPMIVSQPDKDQRLVLQEMKLELPEQPRPRLRAPHACAS